MAGVRLDSVTKKFGSVVAVSEVTLDARSGEFFVIVGPSGCGKSTVLRLIAGLEQPDSGDIYIDGKRVNGLAPRDRGIAMVFESPGYALYPHLTAYDNMAFSLRLGKGTPAQEGTGGTDVEQPGARAASRREREGAIRKRVEDVAGRLGLGGMLNRRRSELSAGEGQNVALGKAMVRRPKVFLMDDPLSQLDAKLRATSHIELRDLHRQLGVTIIYVTHDQEEALHLGQRIAVMNEGTVHQVGTPQGVYERPANMFVAGFIGSPPMNMFPVWVESGPEGLYLDGAGFRAPVPDYYAQRLAGREQGKLLLGLRPEHIHDAHYYADAVSTALVSARVQMRQYLGSEIYLFLTASEGGAQEFVARMDGRTKADRGDIVEVAFDMSNMHAFDPASGRSLL